MIRVKATSFLGTAAFLTAFAAGALVAEAASVTSDDTDLMTGPGSSYGRIGEIPGGAAIRVFGCGSSWCQVAYRGARGYVDADDIVYSSAGVLRTLPPQPAPGLAGISDGLSGDGDRRRRRR